MKNTNLSSKQNKLWISAVNDRAQLCPGQCKYRSEFPKSLQKCWVIFTINHMGLRDFKLFIVSWTLWTIGTTRILSESERKSYKCYQHNQWAKENLTNVTNTISERLKSSENVYPENHFISTIQVRYMYVSHKNPKNLLSLCTFSCHQQCWFNYTSLINFRPDTWGSSSTTSVGSLTTDESWWAVTRFSYSTTYRFLYWSPSTIRGPKLQF